KTGSKVVAVGHQRDDDAETILHRVIRGTGLRGLAGIPRARLLREGSDIRLIRPLLRRDRKAILEYLAECSNQEVGRATRNRIRQEVLPLLESQVNPQVREALLRLGEQARWLSDFFGQTVDRSFETLIIARTDQELVLNAAVLAKKSRIIQTELIRRAVTAFQVGEQDLGFAQLVSVLDLVADPASGKEVHLPAGMTVSKRYNRLVFSMPTDESRETVAPEIAVHVPGRTLLPVRRLEIRVEVQDVDQKALRGWLDRQHALSDAPVAARRAAGWVAEEWVDADRTRLPLVVRGRTPGDRFWPLGAPGSKTVSEFLGDSKVEPAERERVAVLCDQLGPIWIIGHRIDERVKLTHSTSRVLQLETRRVEP
ncbi:MAG: tRNA lysidine(34) synthetase TilS, partial [Phycisphaerae bacterium]